MREIKIRAWDKIQKKMIYPELFNFNGKTFKESAKHLIRPLKEVILIQSTGLKDKNGKEIWEGDIVKSIYASTHVHSVDGGRHKEEIMVVRWDTCNPCFVMEDINNKNNIEYDFICCNLRTNEVIGNIYENPELLEKKS